MIFNMVSSGIRDKVYKTFTFNICNLWNPPSQNERLSKGCRIANIKASAQAS